MNKWFKVVLGSLLILSVAATAASADARKGQRYYQKFLHHACGFKGSEMAIKHTQAEWKSIYESGNLPKELKGYCPKAKDKAFKEKFMESYYDFLFKYASDSGNVPSC